MKRVLYVNSAKNATTNQDSFITCCDYIGALNVLYPEYEKYILVRNRPQNINGEYPGINVINISQLDDYDFDNVICEILPHAGIYYMMGQPSGWDKIFMKVFDKYFPSGRLKTVVNDPRFYVGSSIYTAQWKTYTKRGLTPIGFQDRIEAALDDNSPHKYEGGLNVKHPLFYHGESARVTIDGHIQNHRNINPEYPIVFPHAKCIKTANDWRYSIPINVDGGLTVGYTVPGVKCLQSKAMKRQEMFKTFKNTKYAYVSYSQHHVSKIWGPTPRFIHALCLGQIALFHSDLKYLINEQIILDNCIWRSPKDINDLMKKLDNESPEILDEIYDAQLKMFYMYSNMKEFPKFFN